MAAETRGDHLNWVRMGVWDREGQTSRSSGPPKKLTRDGLGERFEHKIQEAPEIENGFLVRNKL